MKAAMLDTGSLAPDFRLARLDGLAVTLPNLLREGPALLAFFKITCPVCQLTFPFLERIHRAGDLRIYGISQNDADSTEEFNFAFKITFPTLIDAEETGYPASNAYRISSVPSLFLVEPDGMISWTMAGFNKKALQELARRAGMTLFHSEDYVPEWKAG